MPVHDWTRVSAGTFHHFHQAWITELARALNLGVLPPDFYALSEQVAGKAVPDVLTLQSLREPLAEQGYQLGGRGGEDSVLPVTGGVQVADAPPRVRTVASISEAAILTLKRHRVVIRHATDDRVVALIEIVSPGNKDGAGPMQTLVDKAVAAVQQGYHLLLLDLFPPGSFDPNGLHDRIWRELSGEAYEPPADKPLMLISYAVGKGVTAYVEPAAVGDELPPMPLFLDPARYVKTPLEATYIAAYESVPLRWRRVIEGVATH
jgi:hypothetical protein